ncbi:MAG: Na+/H+ antiporter subunit C [Caldilineaceae bacterium]|nr:Na+/H+ antiporter subunit C [Caldilineaceae bacterium]
MNILMMALVVGVLFATGTYLILRRRPIRLILGLGLLSHGVNLLLFSLGGAERGLPPIVVDKAAFTGDISGFVDPLPQALILTAIVIGFGVQAFAIVLVKRAYQTVNTDDFDQMRSTDLYEA